MDERFKATAPNGKAIIGTVETLQAVAHLVAVTRGEGGELEVEYDGSTDIEWDTQATLRRDGERIFLDEEHNEWKESDLTFTPSEDKSAAALDESPLETAVELPLCGVCSQPMTDAQAPAHPSCTRSCANCGDPDIAPDDNFCSDHCENKHKGDVCPGACDDCDDDKAE